MSDGLIDPLSKYTVYRCDRKNRDGGGVCILVSKHISSKALDCQFSGLLSESYEIIGCRLYAEGQLNLNCDITVLCVYLPPDITADSFVHAMSAIRSVWDDECIGFIIGDFNQPDIEWCNPCKEFKGLKSKALLDLYTDIGCEQYILEPTRGNNLLDLLFCNDPLFISELSVIPPFSTSDHATILFTAFVDCCLAPVDHSDVNFTSNCDWDKADWNALSQYFGSIKWDIKFSQCTNSNELFNVLQTKFYESICLFVPSRNYRPTRRSGTKNVPRFVKKLQDKKLDCWHDLKEESSLSNYIHYRQSAAAVKLAFLKDNYYKESKILASNNLGKFYKHINSRLSHRAGIAPLKDSNGTIAFSDRDKADLLNLTFTNARTVDNKVFPECQSNEHNNRLDFVVFNPFLVESKLKKLKTGSTPGPDEIPSLFFKMLAPKLAYPLALLFTMLLHYGTVPDCWKLAIVTPIFKKGLASNPENYRPISLTCIICKVFESIIKDNLIKFVSLNQTLTHAQHGFLARHSTTSNLLECLNDWTRRLEEGLDTDVVYIDIAKAFDSVSIPKLVYKLSHIGICNPLLSCLTSFLEGRSQKVKVGRSYSSYLPVISGVPQGSVLGPILFIIYVNEIPDMSEVGDVTKLFADDVKRYAITNNTHSVQPGLDRLGQWCRDWQLNLAPTKSCCLKIKRKCNASSDGAKPYTIGGHDIPYVNEYKDLGILVDDHLSFASHINSVISRAKQRVYLLFKCFVSRDILLLMKAYVSYVLPIFDYCSSVYSPFKLSEIDRLESVQRNFTKKLSGLCDLPYDERLAKCGLVSLELRRLRKDLGLCYQIVNGLIALNFADFFTADTNHRTRRNRQKLKIQKMSHVSSRANFFSVRVVPVWNTLTDDIILCGSYKQFCKLIESFDLSPFLKRDWNNSNDSTGF
jgi:hypothetical protein